MVEVRIRLASDARSSHLGEVPFTDVGLDSVFRLVEMWGLQSDGCDDLDMVGQFVLDDSGAYFEIVVGEDA